MRKTDFHQLAYHRIFIILLLELNQPEPVLEAINYQVLQTFRYTYDVIRFVHTDWLPSICLAVLR